MLEEGRLSRAGERSRIAIERAMFGARWLLAPIYLGMVVALLLLLVKFFEELVLTIPQVLTMDASALIVEVLTIVDLSLAANLMLIVMLAGYENFVSSFSTADGAYRPRWLSHIDFSSLKLKLISSICAIASVKLLEVFLDIGNLARDEALMHLAILIGFAFTAVLLALTDRLSVPVDPG